MAEGLEVDLATLAEAARRIEALSSAVSGVAVTAALHRVADALPGGRLAGAADLEAEGWNQVAGALTGTLAAHAAALRSCAATYLAADQALAAAAAAAGAA